MRKNTRHAKTAWHPKQKHLRLQQAVFVGLIAVVGLSLTIITQAATHTTSPAEAYPDDTIIQAKKAAQEMKAAEDRAKQQAASNAAAAAAAAKKPAPAPAPPPATPTQSSARSIRGQSLFVYKPADWASRPRAIYDYQVGKWFGGWSTNLATEVNGVVSQATASGQLALLVAYNIPNRDCSGGYSAGGAGGSAAYRSWIQAFASGIGARKATVVLEPDALPDTACVTNERLADIAYAVDILRTTTQAAVYIDAGNAGWQPANVMADLLKRANVAGANGFAINVSNFKSTSDSANYGDQISRHLAATGVPGARYIIDTSRNGQGAPPNGVWCNPPGRGLGKRPSTLPDQGAYNDAYLWVKTIGESDGDCGRGEPPAGQWFEAYAQALITNAVH